MKRLLLTLPLLLTLALTDSLSAQYPGSPQARVRTYDGFGHVGFFYRPLLHYGEWIELEPGFYAWRPFRTAYGWHPYRLGHWVWSNHGWYWVSNEPFGWAVYHYGRWFYDDYYGWIWVPDDVWGPAWVEWRYDDNYIGWAPLPPYAGFHVSVGIHFTATWNAPYNYWCFVRHGHFTKNNYSHYVVSKSTTRRLIKTTRSAGSYAMDRGTVFNRGIDRSLIEKRGRVRIDTYEVTRSSSQRENVVRSNGVRRIESVRPDPVPERKQSERIDARKATRSSGLQMDRVDRSRREDSDVRSQENRERTPSRTEPIPPTNPTRKDSVRQPERRTRTKENQTPPKKDQSAVLPRNNSRKAPESRSAPSASVTSRLPQREKANTGGDLKRSSATTGRSTPPRPPSEERKKR